MPQYVFNGGYPRYYPSVGLQANQGDVKDLDEAPDSDWTLADGSVKPAEAAIPIAVTNDPVKPSEDALEVAEALLEASPELAQRLVDEAKNA